MKKALATAAKIFRVALFGVVTLVAVVWCLQNQQHLLVSFLPFAYGVELPLFLLVLIVFISGFGLAALLAWPRTLTLRRQLAQARRRMHLLEHDGRQEQLHRQLSAEIQDDEDSLPLIDDERHLPV